MKVSRFASTLPRPCGRGGAPSSRQWVSILKRAALVEPDRDPASGLFLDVRFLGDRLCAVVERRPDLI